jgi:hypothetical protein
MKTDSFMTSQILGRIEHVNCLSPMDLGDLKIEGSINIILFDSSLVKHRLLPAMREMVNVTMGRLDTDFSSFDISLVFLAAL